MWRCNLGISRVISSFLLLCNTSVVPAVLHNSCSRLVVNFFSTKNSSLFANKGQPRVAPQSPGKCGLLIIQRAPDSRRRWTPFPMMHRAQQLTGRSGLCFLFFPIPLASIYGVCVYWELVRALCFHPFESQNVPATLQPPLPAITSRYNYW